MVGESMTLNIAPGKLLTVSQFTTEERARFENDFPALGNIFSRYADGRAGHAIRDLLDRYKQQFMLFAQAAKNDIEGGGGVFEGINATSGFGMQDIRPDHILDGGTGTRSFDISLSGLTKNSFYGWAHNGAIGDAYNATPLYQRKEWGLAICGFIEMQNPIAEEFQWEINGKPMPIWNMVKSMRAGDLRIFEAPQVIYLPPRKQYRSQFKTGAAAGDMSLHPIGVAYVAADSMRTTAPTMPDTTAP